MNICVQRGKFRTYFALQKPIRENAPKLFLTQVFHRIRETKRTKLILQPYPSWEVTSRRHEHNALWALSIQEKFQFEISEIPRAQWNGTFRLHRPDPSHRALGYCSCKQDTKERYWGQQFCQMERDISVRPTEMTRPVTVDHLQSWSRIFRSDQTEMMY